MSERWPADTAALTWRPLTLADTEAMYALHLLSIAGMPAQAVKPESIDFLRGILAGRGTVVGAWDGSALVAYGVLQHDLKPEDARLASGLQVPGSAASLYKLAGAAVHPAWRGLGLQKAVIVQRMQRAPAQSVLFATASPMNVASWYNLSACGFVVRDVQYLYGGHARYVMAYVQDDPWRGSSTQAVTLTPAELDEQHKLLQQGWRGIARGPEAGSLRLVPAHGVVGL